MTIILRLQGLDVKASTEDIRTFFKCLHIPDGGVYIVGGNLREAFIAFTTEKDAQLAMRYSGKALKGSKVTLHISSMDELEHKLKSLLRKKKPSPTQHTINRSQPSPKANLQPLNAGPPPSDLSNTSALVRDPRSVKLSPLHPNTSHRQPSNALESGTAFLLGVCTFPQGLQSHQREKNDSLPRVDLIKAFNKTVPNEVRASEETLTQKSGYARLFGLPASATKEEICHFFSGLKVQEAIVNVKLGLGHCCLVKFASEQEACEAFLFNQQSLGPHCVEVCGATEMMWTSALQECEPMLDAGERRKPKKSPLRETLNHKQKPTALQIKRQFANWLPPKSSKKLRPFGDYSDATAVSSNIEYTVMVSGLPKSITKTQIKELLGCPNIGYKNVLHLFDKEGNKTDTAFAIFNNKEDYDYAMNLTGCHVGSNAIDISSISKVMMRDMMAKTHLRIRDPDEKKPNQKILPVETLEDPSVNTDPAAQTWLFVRNMPADVQKSQIKSLLCKHKLKYSSIILLLDSNCRSIGEAVVEFKSEKLAALALKLNGQDFLGSKLLLSCINIQQMKNILRRNV